VRNISDQILQLGYVLRHQDFGHSVAMLLGRNPAVDQSLPKRSECLLAVLVRSKPLRPLVVCQHALTIVREPVIKSSALLCLPLRWTWATAARKPCYPDRRARQDLQPATWTRSSATDEVDLRGEVGHGARTHQRRPTPASGCTRGRPCLEPPTSACLRQRPDARSSAFACRLLDPCTQLRQWRFVKSDSPGRTIAERTTRKPFGEQHGCVVGQEHG
jgi:hypothetical protein